MGDPVSTDRGSIHGEVFRLKATHWVTFLGVRTTTEAERRRGVAPYVCEEFLRNAGETIEVTDIHRWSDLVRFITLDGYVCVTHDSDFEAA